MTLRLPANPGYSPASALHLPVERAWLYRPSSQWTFSHHPSLTWFNGRYLAIWSNGRQDEDAPGQRVLLATSRDFRSWSEPIPLFDTQPGCHSDMVLTAAGFHQHGGRLTAYTGRYEYARDALVDGRRYPDGRGHLGTTLISSTTADGADWESFCDLGLTMVPNHGPQATASGRLIISGNVAFPYSDEPDGFAGWRMTGIYPPEAAARLVDDSESLYQLRSRYAWPVAFCEGSFYQTDDGVLRMMLRSDLSQLWVSESRDDGATWSAPRETDFSDNASKFHFGRLPDGRFYYVGCPDPEPRWTRSPLVLSLSQDGLRFDRHFILADSPCEQRAVGMHKVGDYGYPHTLVHDGHLHVIISRHKESIEVLRIPLATLS